MHVAAVRRCGAAWSRAGTGTGPACGPLRLPAVTLTRCVSEGVTPGVQPEARRWASMASESPLAAVASPAVKAVVQQQGVLLMKLHSTLTAIGAAADDLKLLEDLNSQLDSFMVRAYALTRACPTDATCCLCRRSR